MIPKSNTKRWGALAGGYLRAAIWRDMVELDKMQNPNGFDWLMREWKKNKTLRSPTVHFNNTVGNLILSELYDFTAQDIVRGFTEFAARGELYQEAVREGIFGSGFILTEINGQDMDKVIKDVIKEVEAAETGGRTNMQRVFDIFAKPTGRCSDAYRWEDEIFRLISYMKDRDNGMEQADAAQNAIDRFPELRHPRAVGERAAPHHPPVRLLHLRVRPAVAEGDGAEALEGGEDCGARLRADGALVGDGARRRG